MLKLLNKYLAHNYIINKKIFINYINNATNNTREAKIKNPRVYV